jgi:hypothetical protein
MVEMRENGFTFVKKVENVWKDMDTDKVKLMVSKSLQKASRHYKKTKAKWKAGEDNGDEDAGDESSADVVDNNRCIECDEPSSHSCQRCKRCVCSICCETKRGLEMAWWCEEYSSGDEDKE